MTFSGIQVDEWSRLSVHRPDDIPKILDMIENEIENMKRKVRGKPLPNVITQKVNRTWIENIDEKIFCLNKNRGGIYLYHMRKAAGTSLRTFLKHLAIVHRMTYHETEGKVSNHLVLNIPGMISFTSLRCPLHTRF